MSFHVHCHSLIKLYIRATCALWEAGYVRVGKGVLTLEGVGQHAQSRPADDRHLGAVLRLRQQPVSCLLVLVMTAVKKKKRKEELIYNSL